MPDGMKDSVNAARVSKYLETKINFSNVKETFPALTESTVIKNNRTHQNTLER